MGASRLNLQCKSIQRRKMRPPQRYIKSSNSIAGLPLKTIEIEDMNLDSGVISLRDRPEAPFSRIQYEQELWAQGFESIAGIDEVGRGCLFGPVVAAAVILPPGLLLSEVRDSKQLSPKQRVKLYDEITTVAVSWAVGVVSVEEIEKINIKQASRFAMKLAVSGLKVAPEWLLIDAESIELPLPQTSLIKGDDLSQSIAAASIVAKVTRDLMAQEWELEFPGYGLVRNKGYASAEHWAGLALQGPTSLHRATFLRKWTQRQLDLFQFEASSASEDTL